MKATGNEFLKSQSIRFRIEILTGLKRIRIHDVDEENYVLIQHINPWHPLIWITLPFVFIGFSFLYGFGDAIEELRHSTRFNRY